MPADVLNTWEGLLGHGSVPRRRRSLPLLQESNLILSFWKKRALFCSETGLRSSFSSGPLQLNFLLSQCWCFVFFLQKLTRILIALYFSLGVLDHQRTAGYTSFKINISYVQQGDWCILNMSVQSYCTLGQRCKPIQPWPVSHPPPHAKRFCKIKIQQTEKGRRKGSHHGTSKHFTNAPSLHNPKRRYQCTTRKKSFHLLKLFVFYLCQL